PHRRAAPALLAVAGGAVVAIEHVEAHNLLGLPFEADPARLARQLTRREHERERPQAFHRGRPPSMPARSANDALCIVRTRRLRETTHPAVSPKPICDAMNQPQLIRWLSTGLTISIVGASSAVQAS